MIQQVPAHLGRPRGTFALRSPVRPNPIALATVELVSIDGATLVVRSVDCVDGTPLVDIKPYFASVDSFPARQAAMKARSRNLTARRHPAWRRSAPSSG